MSAREGTLAQVLVGEADWVVVEGDCLEVLPTIPDKAVAHVITDPPYQQRTSDNARSAPDGVKGSALNECHAFIGFAGVDGLEAQIAREAIRVASRWVVIWSAMEQIGTYALAEPKSWVRSTVWLRTNSAPQFTGDRPGQAVEAINILHRKGRKRWNRGGDCWAPVGPTINSIKDAQRGTLGHPTPKPEWLMIETLDAFTDPGELVLDAFCGSGTTGVACLRLDRRFIGIEKDPKYAAVARERLRAESQGLSLRDARAGQTSLFGESP